MPRAVILNQATREGWTDENVIQRVLAGQTPLYEILMRRYNQRIYSVVKAILRDESEAEDVVQDTNVRAYEHLADFEGRAKFSTWLTRIAVHEALARSRRHGRVRRLETPDDWTGDMMSALESATPSPERLAYVRELGGAMESAILRLPEHYRLVFTMREIEDMSTAESAYCLNVTEGNLKVMLHRARAFLRKELYARGITWAPWLEGHLFRKIDAASPQSAGSTVHKTRLTSLANIYARLDSVARTRKRKKTR